MGYWRITTQAEWDALESEVKTLREELAEARQAHNKEMGGFFWDEGVRIHPDNVLGELSRVRSELKAAQDQGAALRQDVIAYVMACMVAEQITEENGYTAKCALSGIPDGYACPSAHVCVGWVENALHEAFDEANREMEHD